MQQINAKGFIIIDFVLYVICICYTAVYYNSNFYAL